MDKNFDMQKFISQVTNSCSKSIRKKFKKGEVITTYISKYNQICILVDGSASLIRFDFYGNRTIIGQFSKNQVFGGALYPTSTNNELVVIANKNSDVLFFNYDDILEGCEETCSFHKKFSSNLSMLVLSTVSELNLRIELLSNKTIREKLLSYFNILSTKKLKKSFLIPYSYTDLADYLSVDRSAMMRELKTLQEEGFIQKDEKNITLLY